MNDKAKIEEMNFEQAMASLENIVKQLESGKIDLDAAIETYAEGMALKNHCEQKLKAAQERIEKISEKSDGTITVEPFNA